MRRSSVRFLQAARIPPANDGGSTTATAFLQPAGHGWARSRRRSRPVLGVPAVGFARIGISSTPCGSLAERSGIPCGSASRVVPVAGSPATGRKGRRAAVTAGARFLLDFLRSRTTGPAAQGTPVRRAAHRHARRRPPRHRRRGSELRARLQESHGKALLGRVPAITSGTGQVNPPHRTGPQRELPPGQAPSSSLRSSAVVRRTSSRMGGSVCSVIAPRVSVWNATG